MSRSSLRQAGGRGSSPSAAAHPPYNEQLAAPVEYPIVAAKRGQRKVLNPADTSTVSGGKKLYSKSPYQLRWRSSKREAEMPKSPIAMQGHTQWQQPICLQYTQTN